MAEAGEWNSDWAWLNSTRRVGCAGTRGKNARGIGVGEDDQGQGRVCERGWSRTQLRFLGGNSVILKIYKRTNFEKDGSVERNMSIASQMIILVIAKYCHIP